MFRDLGFPEEEAHILALRSELMISIEKAVIGSRLTISSTWMLSLRLRLVRACGSSSGSCVSELLGRGPFHGVVRWNPARTPRDDRPLKQSASVHYLTMRRKTVQAITLDVINAWL